MAASTSYVRETEVVQNDGAAATLGDIIGDKVAVIVNVASRCGFTPQYKGLQELHDSSEDVVVIGVPCNQFGKQEPGTDAEIKAFVESRYKVTFPLLAKTEVNGAGEHSLYTALKSQAGVAAVRWNFEKFVLGKDGAVAHHFDSGTTPEAVREAVDKLL